MKVLYLLLLSLYLLFSLIAPGELGDRGSRATRAVRTAGLCTLRVEQPDSIPKVEVGRQQEAC